MNTNLSLSSKGNKGISVKRETERRARESFKRTLTVSAGRRRCFFKWAVSSPNLFLHQRLAKTHDGLLEGSRKLPSFILYSVQWKTLVLFCRTSTVGTYLWSQFKGCFIVPSLTSVGSKKNLKSCQLCSNSQQYYLGVLGGTLVYTAKNRGQHPCIWNQKYLRIQDIYTTFSTICNFWMGASIMWLQIVACLINTPPGSPLICKNHSTL